MNRKDLYIEKLKERIQLIECATPKTSDNSKMDEIQGKYKNLKNQYNQLVDEIKLKEKEINQLKS